MSTTNPWPAGAGPAAEDWSDVGRRYQAEAVAAGLRLPTVAPLPSPDVMNSAPKQVREAVEKAAHALAELATAARAVGQAEQARTEADIADFGRQVEAKEAGRSDPGTPDRDKADFELTRSRRAHQVAVEVARRSRQAAIDTVRQQASVYQQEVDKRWKALINVRRAKALAELASIDLELDRLTAEERFLTEPERRSQLLNPPTTSGSSTVLEQLRSRYDPDA